MLETRLISDLIPYDRNPRDNAEAVDHVLESLRLHGQVKPIVLSAVGHPFEQEIICCGHTTMQALKKFGATEAKVIVKSFDSEAEFVDYNIRDNKTSEFAKWNESELVNLCSEFEIDLEGMGFSIPDEEDFSDKNQEIDMDSLDDTCELKIKMDAETYENVLGALHLLDDDILKALLKALNVS